jgi:hypothetical protein
MNHIFGETLLIVKDIWPNRMRFFLSVRCGYDIPFSSQGERQALAHYTSVYPSDTTQDGFIGNSVFSTSSASSFTIRTSGKV